MKRQVRRGVFETNSSSTHSITMCSNKEYENGKTVKFYIGKTEINLALEKKLLRN